MCDTDGTRGAKKSIPQHEHNQNFKKCRDGEQETAKSQIRVNLAA
uniref:Uncharacterized protein n=1 Tax=Heterorhabditis bacteriophora TaxID=37862 RepID=A0A1I7WUP8_HETBA